MGTRQKERKSPAYTSCLFTFACYYAPMPPESPREPQTDTDFQLPPGHKSGAGPIVGVIIIVIVLALGGLYFWGAQLNRETEPLPLIPGDSSPQQ